MLGLVDWAADLIGKCAGALLGRRTEGVLRSGPPEVISVACLLAGASALADLRSVLGCGSEGALVFFEGTGIPFQS